MSSRNAANSLFTGSSRSSDGVSVGSSFARAPGSRAPSVTGEAVAYSVVEGDARRDAGLRSVLLPQPAAAAGPPRSVYVNPRGLPVADTQPVTQGDRPQGERPQVPQGPSIPVGAGSDPRQADIHQLLCEQVATLTAENQMLSEQLVGLKTANDHLSAGARTHKDDYAKLFQQYQHVSKLFDSSSDDIAALKKQIAFLEARDKENVALSKILQNENAQLRAGQAVTGPAPAGGAADIQVIPMAEATPYVLPIDSVVCSRVVDFGGQSVMLRVSRDIALVSVPKQDNPVVPDGGAAEAQGHDKAAHIQQWIAQSEPVSGSSHGDTVCSAPLAQAPQVMDVKSLLATEPFVNQVIRHVAEADTTSKLVRILQTINPTPMQVWTQLISDIVKNDMPGFVRPTDPDLFAKQLAGEILQIQLTPAAFDKAAFAQMKENRVVYDGDYTCLPHGLPVLVATSLKETPFDPSKHGEKFHTAMIYQYFAWGTEEGKALMDVVKAQPDKAGAGAAEQGKGGAGAAGKAEMPVKKGFMQALRGVTVSSVTSAMLPLLGALSSDSD